MEFDQVEKLLIFRIGSIGDTVVALPCFHLIRRTFPKANITLLSNAPILSNAAPVFSVLGQDNRFVDDIIIYTSFSSNPLAFLKLILRLRKSKISSLVYLMPSRTSKQLKRDKLFFSLAGITQILCMPENNDQAYPRIEASTNLIEPEARRLCRSTSILGEINLHDHLQWDLCFNSDEINKGKTLASKIPSPFLAVHIGAHLAGAKKSKDWGLERWSELILKLRDQSNVRGLMIIGSSEDSERSQALVNIWGKGAISYCGQLTPRESASALLHAKLFCGHDSGPLHLSSCVGIPTIGLFGDHNKPKEWHPIGPHVKVIHETRGIDKITVDMVLEIMGEIWDDPNSNFDRNKKNKHVVCLD